MEIAVIILLILLNGVFAMSEIAVISAKKNRLKTEAKNGSKSARTALKLAEDPDRFLSTIQIGITLIGILTGIYSGARLSDDFADMLVYAFAIPVDFADELAQLLIVATVTYLTLIFGELLPKRIGLGAAERVAKTIAVPMRMLSVVASPFVWILAKSTSVIFRMCGIRESGEKVTEQDIRMMVEEGAKGGEVHPMEQDIVERTFLIGDLKVETLMTRRSEIVALDAASQRDEIRKTVAETVFQAYPVIEQSLDNIVGIVRLKDIVTSLDKPDFSLQSICRQPTALYENMPVYSAFSKMQAERCNVALVFDEFGSCSGILSMKDIFAALSGLDENSPADAMITPSSDPKMPWLVVGNCPIFEFLRHFQIDTANENLTDYSTVAGLLLGIFGRIPAEGDSIEWKQFLFSIKRMDGARIAQIAVARRQNPEEATWE